MSFLSSQQPLLFPLLSLPFVQEICRSVKNGIRTQFESYTDSIDAFVIFSSSLSAADKFFFVQNIRLSASVFKLIDDICHGFSGQDHIDRL